MGTVAGATPGRRCRYASFQLPLCASHRWVCPSVGDQRRLCKKKQNDVPTLTGSNKDEGGASPHPNVTLEQFRKLARDRYEESAEEFLQLYPAKTDEEATIAQNDAARDGSRVSTYLWAIGRKKTAGSRVWTYFGDHALPGPDADKYGAFHTSEVPYVLGALAMSDRPFTADDRRIADMMTSYWANFIAKGDPNREGLKSWPAISDKPGFTMELGDKTAAIPVAGRDEAEVLGEILFAAAFAAALTLRMAAPEEPI